MPSYHTPFLLVSVIHFITGLRERVLLEITVWTTSETSSPCHFTVSLDFLYCHYLGLATRTYHRALRDRLTVSHSHTSASHREFEDTEPHHNTTPRTFRFTHHLLPSLALLLFSSLHHIPSTSDLSHFSPLTM